MSRPVQSLSREQCLARLARLAVGRVSVSMNALPVIVPVDYRVDGDSVVFSAPLDRAIALACDGSVIAFEADDFATTAETDARWSVHVLGVGALVGDGTEQVVRLQANRLSGHEVDIVRTHQ